MIIIVIVIVKEPYPSAVIIAKSIEFFTCPTLSACSWSDVYSRKNNKQSLAITKKPCISSIFPPDLDKSFIWYSKGADVAAPFVNRYDLSHDSKSPFEKNRYFWDQAKYINIIPDCTFRNPLKCRLRV